MINLISLQKEIIANRIRRGFPSASDLSKTTRGLEEEFLEWKQALETQNNPEMIDALGDLIVYCLGGLEILGCDSEDVITNIVERNKNRSHKKIH